MRTDELIKMILALDTELNNLDDENNLILIRYGYVDEDNEDILAEYNQKLLLRKCYIRELENRFE